MFKSFVLMAMLMLPILFGACQTDEGSPAEGNEILGFELLTDISGHWVGTNQTVYGFYDWFAFDFRPISASHIHSIYEGGTAQNIINSFFVAEYDGELQIMGRNGGWLGPQYRATYFMLDKAEINGSSRYYRLVDAVGGINRSYMELRFESDSLFFDAYKDNSGTLDEPIHHMGFRGTNRNPQFAEQATDLFDYPKAVAELDLTGQFENLIDPDSALFLEETDDPFPKSMHGHLSDLTINIERAAAIDEQALLLYISTEPLIDTQGNLDFNALDNKVTRTIDVQGYEAFYTATYLHPDSYYLMTFADLDGNFYPSTGDVTSVSQAVTVNPETHPTTSLSVNMQL